MRSKNALKASTMSESSWKIYQSRRKPVRITFIIPMNMDITSQHYSLRAPWRGMAVLAGLLFISCIERSNPFDPINARGTVAATVRAANQAKLDALSAQRAELAAFLSEYLAGFSKAQGENGVTSGINAAVWEIGRASCREGGWKKRGA